MACANSLDNDDGPVEAENERVLTGKRWGFGERVAPKDSAAVTPLGCTGSVGGSLMGHSRGGLEAVSGEDGLTVLLCDVLLKHYPVASSPQLRDGSTSYHRRDCMDSC